MTALTEIKFYCCLGLEIKPKAVCPLQELSVRLFLTVEPSTLDWEQQNKFARWLKKKMIIIKWINETATLVRYKSSESKVKMFSKTRKIIQFIWKQ